MKKSLGIIKTFLAILDFFLFFLSLTIVLYFRFKNNFYIEFAHHFYPFFFLYFFVLLIFLAFSLYEIYLLTLKNLISKVFNAFLVIFVFSSFYFYFSQIFFKISPKTNLILFLLIFIFLVFFLRYIVFKFLIRKKIQVYFLGSNELEKKLEEDIEGISIFEFKGDFWKIQPENDSILIIADYSLDKKFFEYLNNFKINITIFDFITFYEKFLGRIPLEALKIDLVIKEIYPSETKIYSLLKRIIDIIIGIIVLIFIFIPLFPFISFFIYISSPGSIFFTQERIGYKGKVFKLIKFRTMHPAPDPHRWATEAESKRIFFFGKILRKTHLDELPQIFNLLKGEISIVGPRPEQPQIAKELENKIPFYELRYLVPPGITGWAQVNYKYPETIKETKVKLEYDLYYIKNSNPFLDILIIIKTFQKFLG